jgi:chemotaxis family two-component system response regulator Rcp1
MATKPIQISIVLVEDNPADVVLARMTLDAVGKTEVECSYELTVLTDGAQAVTYFEDETKPRPDLLILDLNLPKVPGFEVLERIRKRADYEDLDVVILSSSHDSDEHQRAQTLGVREYFHKPESLSGYRVLAGHGRLIGQELIARKR